MHRFIIISRTQAVVALSLVSFLLVQPLQAQDPNLIDVTTFAQLDAMRHDLDGDGVPTNAGLADWNAAFSMSLTTGDANDAVNTVPGGGSVTGYELMVNLDFAGTLWAEGATVPGARATGWNPIGTNSKKFTAIFEGNDYTISNLYINRTDDNIGLFRHLGTGGEIRNLGIKDAHVTGNDRVGCLVGQSNSGSTITTCYYATGNVTGSDDAGGLVGRNKGNITDCYATGNVTGSDDAGGLVGQNEGNITDCYATGDVTGYFAGGLVGRNDDGGTISACHATGNATGNSYFSTAGGLVGKNDDGSTISACYATGSATASFAGGLVGEGDSSMITACYATGNVRGDFAIGGLVGYDSGSTIPACYATGSVTLTAAGTAGGLVGQSNSGTITACYATGSVTVSSNNGTVGGLVGQNGGEIMHSYFDTDKSSATDGVGSSSTNIITGLDKTTAELQAPTGYADIYADWNIDLDDADVDIGCG